jgi:Tol biopolymer transport system component
VPADGSSKPVRLTQLPAGTSHWSPDGKRVAFAAFSVVDDLSERELLLGNNLSSDIAILELDGQSEPWFIRDSPAGEIQPRFAPSGDYLAYASDESGRMEIYVTTFPDGDRRWQISVDGGRFPRWSPSGDEIFFVAGSHLMVASFRAGTELQIGAPKLLISSHEQSFAFATFGQTLYDVTPDGNVLARHIQADDELAAIVIQNWPKLLERAR